MIRTFEASVPSVPMAGLSRHLTQLEKELLALGEETMLIQELDGFIAGLLVCPELIKPVSGYQSSGVRIVTIRHYNDVARTLMDRPDRYSPLFAVDERNGDILREHWIEGFEKAVKLRPGTWQKLLNTDANTATAMRGMLTLADIARGDQHLPRKDRDALTATAPDDIARWIVTLNEWRLANNRPMQDVVPMPRSPFTSAQNIGRNCRNDPCPCRSGKKCKRCCGLH
jgi:uncharacterized protein